MVYNKTSIITFLYPASEKYLGNLVADLNKQTDKNFSVIAFNDGVQHPEQWLKSLQMPYQVIEVEGSTPMAIRFEALKRLHTMDFEYLIFQDSDDGLSTNRVEVVSELLQDYPLVVNDLDIMDDTGQVGSTHIWKERFDAAPVFNSKDLLDYNFAGLGNTAIRTGLLEVAPKQPTQELIAVDWYIFYSVLATAGISGYRTSQCTTLYRQHSQNSVGQMTAEKKDLALQVRALHVAALQEQGMKVPSSIVEKQSKNTYHHYNHPFWWQIAQ